MQNLIYIFVVYLFLLAVSMIIARGRISEPSVIFSLSMVAMLFLALACYSYFDFNIQMKTVGLMCTSGMLFVLIDGLYGLSYKQQIRSEHQLYLASAISVKKGTLNFLIVLSIVILFFIVRMIYSVGSGSLSQHMNAYKTMMVSNAGLIPFRTINSQLYKIALGYSYVISYILVYNKAVDKKSKIEIREVIIIVLYMAISFFSEAARQPVVEIIVFMSLCYVFLIQREENKRELFRFIRRMIPIVIIIAFAFFHTMTLAGRVFHEGKTVIHYIAEYFCGGLYSLNIHINEPARSAYFGQTSFVEIYGFLSKVGLFSAQNVKQHYFDKFGNTATIFGRWYEDWGFLGVYFMTVITSIFFSRLYRNTRRAIGTVKSHIRIIIYLFLVIALVWAGYDDRVKAIMSTTMVLKLLCIYFFYYWLIAKKIKIK